MRGDTALGMTQTSVIPTVPPTTDAKPKKTAPDALGIGGGFLTFQRDGGKGAGGVGRGAGGAGSFGRVFSGSAAGIRFGGCLRVYLRTGNMTNSEGFFT